MNIEKKETTKERLDKIPIDQDELFLIAMKEELINLMNRLRSETLQKLELLK